jgi:flagellar protein FliS
MDVIEAYRENTVTTQTQGRLVVLLYDGAIKFLKQAVKEIQAGQWAQKGEYINKAIAIINELNSSLDMESGGEIADNLRQLYNFMTKHLAEANIRRDIQKIRDVIACLNDLNEGWKAATA